MKNIMKKMLEKSEKESWNESKTILYQVYKKVKTPDRSRAVTLSVDIIEQSKMYPRGITEEKAKQLGDVVYRKIVIRQRIK